MLLDSIENFAHYEPQLKSETLQALASLALEGLYPDENLLQDLVSRDTGKITAAAFLAKALP